MQNFINDNHIVFTRAAFIENDLYRADKGMITAKQRVILHQFYFKAPNRPGIIPNNIVRQLVKRVCARSGDFDELRLLHAICFLKCTWNYLPPRP